MILSSIRSLKRKWLRQTPLLLAATLGASALTGCGHDDGPRVVERVEYREPYPASGSMTPAPPPNYSDSTAYSNPPAVQVDRVTPAPADEPGIVPAPAYGQVQVEGQYQPPPADVYTVYQQDLAPYGNWVDVAPYGRCWVPNNQAS